MENRERLGSRMGFILLSAGCAIGCGNVWKFPWLTGANGGGGFVLVYILCLLLLGLPVLLLEFAMGRASQASPVRMYQNLQGPKGKWQIHGYLSFFGNICLMAFYSVVVGWMMHYCVQFALGNTAELSFGGMISNPTVNIVYLAIAVALGFLILSFGLKSGLEKVTKWMMGMLFLLIVILAVRSCTLSGAKEGLAFYLVPDFSKITFSTAVAAMNQAFFTLGLGIGSMAVFGSYIGKERSLLGESLTIIGLDTFVALVAGIIIFPACFTYGEEVGAGPGLLFNTMASVFNHMEGGRLWGTIFFLFMVFAALSTELAVYENILACAREMTGWSRPKGSIVCAIGMFLVASTTALGYSTFAGFVPFAEGSAWLDLWDFIVNTNLLPIGALAFTAFCCYDNFGWGWDNFLAEVNAGKGLKLPAWTKNFFRFVLPPIVLFLYIYGLVTFAWK